MERGRDYAHPLGRVGPVMLKTVRRVRDKSLHDQESGRLSGTSITARREQ
jgi:hypothetical protein